MSNKVPDQTFHSECLPIRGEFVAWIMTLVIGFVWICLIILKINNIILIPILFFILLVSALLIRINNYIDAHTIIHFYVDRLEFEDGLRKIILPWNEIERIVVYQSTWGKKIHVSGKERRFNFRTLGVVKLGGEIKGKIGFNEGKMILDTILSRSQLTFLETNNNCEYYTRQ
jgi:hypothetical protein